MPKRIVNGFQFPWYELKSQMLRYNMLNLLWFANSLCNLLSLFLFTISNNTSGKYSAEHWVGSTDVSNPFFNLIDRSLALLTKFCIKFIRSFGLICSLKSRISDWELNAHRLWGKSASDRKMLNIRWTHPCFLRFQPFHWKLRCSKIGVGTQHRSLLWWHVFP